MTVEELVQLIRTDPTVRQEIARFIFDDCIFVGDGGIEDQTTGWMIVQRDILKPRLPLREVLRRDRG